MLNNFCYGYRRMPLGPPPPYSEFDNMNASSNTELCLNRGNRYDTHFDIIHCHLSLAIVHPVQISEIDVQNTKSKLSKMMASYMRTDL
jgi:hypothetical protein